MRDSIAYLPTLAIPTPASKVQPSRQPGLTLTREEDENLASYLKGHILAQSAPTSGDTSKPAKVKLPLNAGAWIALTLTQAAKGLVGFSGVMCAVLAGAYPSYNVLKFAAGDAEKALARLAYVQFSHALYHLLFSIMFGVLCLCYLPVGIMSLKADQHYTAEKTAALYNSAWTWIIVPVLFGISAIGAFQGFNAAAAFFSASGR